MRALIFIVVFAVALPLFADTIYDPYGKYKGLLDDKGRFFDSQGSYMVSLQLREAFTHLTVSFWEPLNQMERSMTHTVDIKVS